MSTVLYYLGQIAFLLALFVVIGYPLHLWERKARKKKMDAAFAGRKPLDEQSFYEAYFQPRGVPFDVVVKVRHILEDVLEADMSRLSAEDDFSRNLSFFWEYDSMADVEIVTRLEEEFGIKIADMEAQQIRTIENVVSLVWSKLRPQRGD